MAHEAGASRCCLAKIENLRASWQVFVEGEFLPGAEEVFSAMAVQAALTSGLTGAVFYIHAGTPQELDARSVWYHDATPLCPACGSDMIDWLEGTACTVCPPEASA